MPVSTFFNSLRTSRASMTYATPRVYRLVTCSPFMPGIINQIRADISADIKLGTSARNAQNISASTFVYLLW